MSLLERRLARWQACLDAGEPVELRIRWWLAWPLALISLTMAGVAGWLLRLHHESVGASVLLAVFALLMGAAGAVQVGVLLRRRGPAVVIDQTGVHLPWMHLDAPWRVVNGAGVMRVRMMPILYLQLRPSFKQAWLEQRQAGRALRILHRLDDTVTLPFPLAADADHVAAWISRLARERWGQNVPKEH